MEAALLLGCCSFMISLPLTIDAQRSLGARVQERFGVDIDGEQRGDAIAADVAESELVKPDQKRDGSDD
jgi:hypothetical protein